jgi:hypothetical protein
MLVQNAAQHFQWQAAVRAWLETTPARMVCCARRKSRRRASAVGPGKFSSRAAAGRCS